MTSNSSSSKRRWLTLTNLFVLLGLILVVLFGLRVVRSYFRLRFAGLTPGAATVGDIRPWMTIRYISAAYAVPEEYLLTQLELPMTDETRNASLRRLNRQFGLGRSESGEEPLILNRVRQAIAQYQIRPVITGLDDIRAWMSILYISNATGVPAAYLFEEIGIPGQGNEFKPLRQLNDEYNFGSVDALTTAVWEAISRYGSE